MSALEAILRRNVEHELQEQNRCTAPEPTSSSEFNTSQATPASANAAAPTKPPSFTSPAKHVQHPSPGVSTGPPQTESAAAAATPTPAAYTMPFSPYDVQSGMMSSIDAALCSSGKRAVPVVAVEVPTGCGKTLALLSSVLRYQASLKRLPTAEARRCLAKGDYWKVIRQTEAAVAAGRALETVPPSTDQQRSTARRGAARHPKQGTARRRQPSPPSAAVAEEDEWAAPAIFSKMSNSRTGLLRTAVDAGSASQLRRRFTAPPCTIFYATRTHAQLRQTVHELRRLSRAEQTVRMNILGSRERYCIHPSITKAKANHTISLDSGHLSEVCEKLLSLGQCACIEKYEQLAADAIAAPIAGRRGQIWDLEDLVAEGQADPLIRHECHMDGAIRNHSIIVLDEAHHVADVCQEALSIGFTVLHLRQIVNELQPLLSPAADPASAGTFLSYPRDFSLRGYTLPQLFGVLLRVFEAVLAYFSELSRRAAATGSSGGDATYVTGVALAQQVLAALANHASDRRLDAGADEAADAVTTTTPRATDASWKVAFKTAYGVIMSFGTVFNPVHFSTHVLAAMKRWLLVLRYLLERPSAFALHAERQALEDVVGQKQGRAARAGDHDGGSGEDQRAALNSEEARMHCELRCLEGRFAFQHLVQGTQRVVLASGTLGPFPQLQKDLGLPPQAMRTFEGTHVVPGSQYVMHALTQLPADATHRPQPLRCTYNNLSSHAFMAGLARTVVRLASQVPAGGVLIFVPNYSVLQTLAAETRAVLAESSAAAPSHAERPAQPLVVFAEPRKATELNDVLDRFRSITARRVALLFAVYRGKVSEGIDFTDEMARLVLCVGLPYKPLKSWRTMAQRDFSGPEWYQADAVRAVNQALGRCLRHAKDYGAVVLLDERYAQPDYQQRLSLWCRDRVQAEASLSRTCASLGEFFNTKHVERQEELRQRGQAGVAPALAAQSGAPASSTSAGSVTIHDRRGSRVDLLHSHRVPCTSSLAASQPSFEAAPTVGNLHASSCTRGAHAPAQSAAVEQPSFTVKRGLADANRAAVSSATRSARQHPWSGTAIKLLYEGVEETADVLPSSFTDAVDYLDRTFVDADCES